MKLSDLISERRITAMTHDELMERIRKLRERRMRWTPREDNKPKAKRASKTPLEKLITGMSAEQRAALLASLEEE